jgi:hypothetical protein
MSDTETSEDPIFSLVFDSFGQAITSQRPLNKDIAIPNNPIAPMPMMTNPIGTLPVPEKLSSDGRVGITRGGGAVKVGKCVGGISITNWAANVGSTVGVVRGVGVGGGSTTGTDPESSTYGE